MKALIYFLIFFVNTLIAIYFRYPLPLGFSIICLAITILFYLRPEEDSTTPQKQIEN